jgi:hypothetical protein
MFCHSPRRVDTQSGRIRYYSSAGEMPSPFVLVNIKYYAFLKSFRKNNILFKILILRNVNFFWGFFFRVFGSEDSLVYS